MALVDAAVARPEVDQERTAAMGGSFGGYMANWVAGETDRFRCIVTHASIWSLEQFHGTTDHAAWWEREFGSPRRCPSATGTTPPTATWTGSARPCWSSTASATTGCRSARPCGSGPT